MRFGLLIAAAIMALSTIAVAADKHESDMQSIDAAMQKSKLTPAQQAKVAKLRQAGAQHHLAGRFKAAEAALAKAKALLKLR